MRTITVKKDQLGYWKYQLLKDWNWIPFPDYVKTKADMDEFFRQGGHYGVKGGKYDPVKLEFVDEMGKEITNYFVKRNGNQISATVNNDQTLTFFENQFITDQEQIEFLQIFSDRKIDKQIETLKNDRERLSILKKNADKETLDKLGELITGKITNDSIKKFCQEHSMKNYNVPANVEFSE